jgi:hypothetical protein
MPPPRPFLEGEAFELIELAACISADPAARLWFISAGARGRILVANPKHRDDCALVEFNPPPIGAPRKFWVRHQDLLLIECL